MLEYSHQAALVQAPVRFKLESEYLNIYPLTIGAILNLNFWLQSEYYHDELNRIEILPESEQSVFIKSINDNIANMSFQSGIGYKYFITHEAAVLKLAMALNRNETPESDLKRLLFKSGLTHGLQIVNEMSASVYRAMPEAPKLQIKQKPPKYKATLEESEARLYKIFADKFGWDYQKVLTLTDYQIFWYTYMYPEDREHIEEMEELSSRNSNDSFGSKTPDVPYQPGTIHFNSPQEYEAWLAKQPRKSK